MNSAIVKTLARTLTTSIVFGLFVAVVAPTQAACSGANGTTCSSSEEQACTNKYTDCTNQAAASGDKAACQKCVDDYCNCYSACGNTCDKNKLAAACQF